jgi:hypothetical protein
MESMLSPAAAKPRRARYISGVEMPRIDGRTLGARRFRALVRHYAEILGDPKPSEADASLIRRCASQAIELEQMDLDRLRGRQVDMDVYVRLSGELRRGEATLGRFGGEA